MKGTIKSFLSDQNFGFIYGENGDTYFFHKNGLDNPFQASELFINVPVEFDVNKTHKGLQAHSVKVIEVNDKVGYITPNEFVLTKGPSVHSWEEIERGEGVVSASSEESPEQAKRLLEVRLKELGANAGVQLVYSKDTDHERSHNGRGIYHFSVHSYTCVPVVVARKVRGGRLKLTSLCGLNNRFEKKLIAQRKQKQQVKCMKNNLALGALVSVSLVAVNPMLAVLPICLVASIFAIDVDPSNNDGLSSFQMWSN